MLPTKCHYVTLERVLANSDGDQTDVAPPCGDCCQFCCDMQKGHCQPQQFPKIVCDGVCGMLFDLFIGEKAEPSLTFD